MRRQTLVFAVVSAALLIFAVAALSYFYRSDAEHEVQALAERNNVTLAQTIARAIDSELNEHVALSAGLSDAALRAAPSTGALGRKIAALVAGTSVAEVTIYSLDARVLFSTHEETIGRSKPTNAGIALAKSGGIASKTAWKDRLDTLEGQISNRNIVESYMPVRDASGTRIAFVFEIYDDVTDLLAEIHDNQVRIVGVVGGLMLLVYLGLLAIVHQGNGRVARAHERSLKLTAAAARAEAANQAKTQFLASMSHELRTPLNAVIGFSQIIKDEIFGPVGASRYRDCACDINDAGNRLLGVFNDILDMVEAEAGTISLALADAAIADTLRDVEQISRMRAQASGVAVAADIDPQLGAWITDHGRLRQIVLSLVGNGIKFTPSGGSVSIRAARRDDRLVIEVADTGIGIGPEDLPTAMAPFGQIDSALSRKYEGAGLGLPLARRLTELLGGTFDIESRVNEGTRVTVSLPALQLPAAPLKLISERRAA